MATLLMMPQEALKLLWTRPGEKKPYALRLALALMSIMRCWIVLSLTRKYLHYKQKMPINWLTIFAGPRLPSSSLLRRPTLRRTAIVPVLRAARDRTYLLPLRLGLKPQMFGKD